jgi:hypothetical protein
MENDRLMVKNKPYYVILTGSKNNAGDFLIKFRAKQLFSRIRPDRDLVDINAWEDRTNDHLELFNDASAIILMGGPALKPNMHPDIYKVLGNIDDITTPIVTMAIGWRAFPGDWSQTHNYKFSQASFKLLKRINDSGFISSVRDYHSLNILINQGLSAFRMTGCAALYDFNYLNNKYDDKQEINKIGFSLGVSFVNSIHHERNFKKLITELQKKFSDKDFFVAFHHSLDDSAFSQSYKKRSFFLKRHLTFVKWLSDNKIQYRDISGSAENLMKFYNEMDLHIGYRVHAHIYMSSVNKPSVLIAEDGRGKALKQVLNGLILDSETHSMVSAKILNRISNTLKSPIKTYNTNNKLTEDVISNLDNEFQSGFSRIKRSRLMIDDNFKQMENFLLQLP